MVVRYYWYSGYGQDLDTATGILNTGIPTRDNNYVGYGQMGEFVPVGTTASSSYLWFALDNTSDAGIEAIVLGVRNIKNHETTLFNKVEIPIAKPIPPSYSPPPQTCFELPNSSQAISKPLPSL